MEPSGLFFIKKELNIRPLKISAKPFAKYGGASCLTRQKLETQAASSKTRKYL